MSLTFFGKLLPYFLAVKLIKKYNDEGAATLQFKYLGKVNTELQGKVRRFDNGEWLFIEDVSELIQKKVLIENNLRRVVAELEKRKVTHD